MADGRTSTGDLGARSPTASVAACCDRVSEIESEVRAFVQPPDRESLSRAAESLTNSFDDDDRPSLYGVPVGVKDIVRVDGFPTRAGSELPTELFDGPEAVVVSRLREAGALIVGKTVTTEFAYFDPGPTRNPLDLEHTPGGSSSGSAAAVASGMCPLAIGTQTVGSVIRPAAFCGVVGYKPSFDRIPTDGIVPFSGSADHVGTFTRTVDGAAVAASVLCNEWGETEQSSRPVIGVPAGAYLDQADSDGLERFEAGVEILSDSGYDVRRVPTLGDIDDVNERHRDMIAAEMALVHDEWFERYGDRYAETTADLIERGFEVRVETLVDARNGRRSLRDRLQSEMNDASIDLWVAPASPGPAPEGIDDTGDPIMNLPWTHAGLPVVTVPGGTSDGLPVGMQCVARFEADESLLSWCSGIRDTLDALP